DAQAPLVALQPAGSKPPFYCVHAGGNVLCYQDLGHRLGRERPMFAVQATQANNQTLAPATVGEMAAEDASLVLGRQPQCPYHLAGWSMGGIVAYEMARQFEERGVQVGLVALLDVPLLGDDAPDDRFDDSASVLLFMDQVAAQMGHHLALNEVDVRRLAV